MLEFVGSSEVGIEVGILGWGMGEDVGISMYSVVFISKLIFMVVSDDKQMAFLVSR